MVASLMINGQNGRAVLAIAKSIAKLFENCHTKETYDYISVSREFNQWLKGEDELEYITESERGLPPMRRSSLRRRRFADFEEENYPKNPQSGKRLAILGKVGNSAKVHFNFKKASLIGCHWDSHGRDLHDGSESSLKNQKKGCGYFWMGGKFSISPGSTFFDFNKNLISETMKRGMGRQESLVVIIHFGTNDLLQFWDTIAANVCTSRFGPLKREYCAICTANFKNPTRKLVHFWENKATRKFREINSLHNLVKLY